MTMTGKQYQQKISANRKQAFKDAAKQYEPELERLEKELDTCQQAYSELQNSADQQLAGWAHQVGVSDERIAELEQENQQLRAANQDRQQLQTRIETLEAENEALHQQVRAGSED